MTDAFELHHLIVALASLGGGLLAGVLVYRFVLRGVVRRATQTSFRVQDLVLGAVRRGTIVWFVIAGAYAARVALPLERRVATIVDTTLLVLVVATATWVLSRLLGDALRLYALRNPSVMPSSSIFINIGRLLVYLVGALVVLQTLGVSITPLLTALGVGGLAIALAMQDTLSNLFAGLNVIASKKVRAGDFIRLETGEEGYVTDVNWRNTAIRQLPNNLVVVPNAKIASAIITNYSRPTQDLSILLDVGVSYDGDLDHVERVTIEVARAVLSTTEGGVKEFEPFIRYHTFGESAVLFTVIMRVHAFVDQYLVKHEFVKALHRRYREEGIVIPFPIRTIKMAGDGDGDGDGDDAARTRTRTARLGGGRSATARRR